MSHQQVLPLNKLQQALPTACSYIQTRKQESCTPFHFHKGIENFIFKVSITCGS